MNKVEYASLNRRIIALCIDLIVLSIVLYPISNVLFISFYDSNPFNDLDFKNYSFSHVNSQLLKVITNVPYMIIQLITLLCVMVYFIFFWVHSGRSIGNYFMRCKVVRANDYKTLNVKKAIIRIFGAFLNIITLGIGFFIADFTKRSQGIHDKLANTVVVINK